MDYTFTSERLGFRAWQKSDYKPFSELNASLVVMEYFPSTLSEAETMAMIDRINNHFENHGFGYWAVDELETKNFIGFIGFGQPRFESFFTPCVEIGWRLSQEFWSKGYATEGAKACLKYGFETLDLDKIYSLTATINQRSEGVMKKIGMKKIGEFDHPIIPNHKLTRHVIYLIKNPSNHE